MELYPYSGQIVRTGNFKEKTAGIPWIIQNEIGQGKSVDAVPAGIRKRLEVREK